MGLTDPHPDDIRNVKAILDVAGVQLRHDLFTGKAVATFNGVNTVIDDSVCQRFWAMFQESDLRAKYHFTCEAIATLSRKITFDSAIDLFTSLPKWDGKIRAETILIDEFGAEDTPYTRGATRLFFASLVRRGKGVESKCDEFVILRGEQNLGKSTLFKILIGEEFYQENLKMSHSTREVLELTLGKLIVEIPELSGMKKAEREDAKTFFSKTFDEFSLKHEKHATRRKRRFTFIGTANKEGPIVNMREEDRRFIIIPVKKIADLERIKRDRLQILAEAIEIEKNYGPKLVLHDELRPEACAQRAQVVARPEYEDALRETFGDIVSAKITVSDVYAFLGLRDNTAIGKYTKTTDGGIVPIMKSLGWERTQLRKGKGRPPSFQKGDGQGWLRASWPHGAQAPAEIEPDWELNPKWQPEYAVNPSAEGVDKGLTGGVDGPNPCGSSPSDTVNTCQHLREDIIREQSPLSSSNHDKDGELYEERRVYKVCGEKVLTPAEMSNSTCKINGLGASTPSFSEGFDGDGVDGLCADGCSD